MHCKDAKPCAIIFPSPTNTLVWMNLSQTRLHVKMHARFLFLTENEASMNKPKCTQVNPITKVCKNTRELMTQKRK